jgi:hypothetical protein
MRLRFSLFSLSPIAQAIGSGRCPFDQGIVPLCFAPHFVVPNSFGVWIVFDCSDRQFFNKTPKSMPKMRKTIKQFILACTPDGRGAEWIVNYPGRG